MLVYFQKTLVNEKNLEVAFRAIAMKLEQFRIDSLILNVKIQAGEGGKCPGYNKLLNLVVFQGSEFYKDADAPLLQSIF